MYVPHGRSVDHWHFAYKLNFVAALTERVVAPLSTPLPVRRGEVLGHVQIWAHGRLLGRRPLIASRTVAAPGVGGRVGWYARRTVHDVVGLFG